MLVWRAPSAQMNPTIDLGVIARAHADDSAAARAEWDAEFRPDLESYVTPEIVAACTVPDRIVLPPMGDVSTWPSAIRAAWARFARTP